MGDKLFTYTTQIEPVKTINEIQNELSSHSAKSILIDYDDGKIIALSFKVETVKGTIGIRLPCNHEPVFKVLKQQYNNGKIPSKFATIEQAYRVAWRIVLYWIKAQMAILETEMVSMDEIFLPYIITNDGRILYQRMLDEKFQIPENL